MDALSDAKTSTKDSSGGKPQRLTWKKLIVLEPRLRTLYEGSKAVRDDRRKPSFCANRVWYLGHLRESVNALVGWHARNGADPRLRTSEAYDIAYHRIYDALPNCRNCACIRILETSMKSARLPGENCARIRDLGFTTSKHILMYGERFELVSDPFEDGIFTSALALSGDDPTIRTLRLPTAILVGLSDRFRKN